MNQRMRAQDTQRGFTLIELLVVLAVIATLSGIAALGIPYMLRRGDEQSMTLALSTLDAAISSYSHDPKNGDFPPTSLDRDNFPGVGNLTNSDNCGIESVILCLNRKGTNSVFEIEDYKNLELRNDDEDRTQSPLTKFGPDVRDLFELVDVWGTPIAYFHHRDYDSVESKDLGRIIGPEGPIKARPWRNGRIKMAYKRESFQLISAGQDGVFNTEDDITNFQRE